VRQNQVGRDSAGRRAGIFFTPVTYLLRKRRTYANAIRHNDRSTTSIERDSTLDFSKFSRRVAGEIAIGERHA
jgi:hypothetical protein